jgi:CS domain
MSKGVPDGGAFTFVFIPADEKESLVELRASKAGGLTDDLLLRHVKQHFTTQLKGDTSVNITALTVPTADNGYQACSLYSMIHSTDTSVEVPFNARANALLTACGHQVRRNDASEGGNAIYGDAFVGRALDDESRDWERLDFTVDDVDPASDWCRQARAVGGVGGAGRKAAASLVNLAQQMGSRSPSVITPPDRSTTNDASYGMDGAAALNEPWGTWTQTAEEVELKLAVPKETTTKDCCVQFHRNRIRVAVKDQVLLEGQSYDPISPDESTFTLQNDGPTGRELCISIGKVDAGRTWMYVAK